MPITPQPTHQAGDYPDTIRHISNGDPANQTFLRPASEDLEYRTDVIKDFVNTLETNQIANFNTLDAFDKNHDHSGSNGEKVLDFSQIYANSNQVAAAFALAEDASFTIQGSGGSPDLFKVDDAAVADRDKVSFAGSDALHDHIEAAASDLTENPHDLRLTPRLLTASIDALIDGATGGPYTEVILDTAAAPGAQFAAPGLNGKSPSDGLTAEGVLVGDLTSPGSLKTNTVLILDANTNQQLLSGSDPVYGLLENIGTVPSPIYRLSFFAAGVAYNFNTDENVRLFVTEAFTLSTVSVGDSRFITYAQFGYNI